MINKRKIKKMLSTPQKQFFILLAVTTFVNIVIYICCMPSRVRKEPAYVLQKTFMTSECADGRRLGNLMFNYASLIGITQRYNVTPVMPADFRLFNIFHITAGKSVNMENTLGSYVNYEEYGKRACAYDVGVEHLKRTNTKLFGYFQSWKYFDQVQHLVRKEFQFKDFILQEAKSLHDTVKSSYNGDDILTIVGIHVRRGDTLETQYSNYGYTTPDEKYYQQAMQYFQSRYQNVHFIVCSDDKEWSKNNIKGDHMSYSEHESDAVDLAILSLCDHMIVSVGSFGWWGAWLANGTTVYYSKWPRPVSKLEYMVTKFHYFYKHWIPLP